MNDMTAGHDLRSANGTVAVTEMTLTRRRVLSSAALAVGVVALTGSSASPSGSETAETANPFLLGVASGDPTPTGVIVWTRLLREQFNVASMPGRPIDVDWQVALDERFRRVVRQGRTSARPELAHSVHVDATGLSPDRVYYYRFRALGQLSPVGRTRTAPAPGADLSSLRFAVANCQDFQNGYYSAYWAMAAEDLDVVFHLGDYIYEYDPRSRFPDRFHVPPQTIGHNQLSTLDDYRNRHAQYKGDPALRAAHAAFPWIATWDDHETENNYAGRIDEPERDPANYQTPDQFARQRAAAYQAYYEHMPIRAQPVPGSPDLRIYRRFDYGRLARFNVLDTRQYRTDQPGGFSNDVGPVQVGMANADGTLTGIDQERWLVDGLVSSAARWNVIAQQVMMSRMLFPNPFSDLPPVVANMDQWDGYAPQRARLLGMIAERQVANPVVLAGDFHSTWISELRVDFDRPETPPVAVEFLSTSISSIFPLRPVGVDDGPIKAANPTLNPHVRYFDGSRYGYLRCTVEPTHWRTDVRNVESIETPQSPVHTEASFVVESGRSAIVPA